MAKADFTSLASLRSPLGVPGDFPVAEVDKKADVVPLRADPHEGEIRGDARPRCALVELAGDYVGSSASSGLSAWALNLALGYALTRPFPLMMRPTRRLEAQNPCRSSTVFILRAP